MNILFRAVGVALIALIALSALKGLGSSLSPFVKICAVALLFGFFLFELSSGIDVLKEIFFSIDNLAPIVKDVIGVMLKALGIALIGKLCSDVCRECGENGIAQGVEAVAGVVIFSLSLPILAKILEFAAEILGRAS